MDQFFSQLAHEFDTPFENQVLVFAVILFIILLIPLILRKLRLPGIIGLILSGLIVGPHGLNWLEKNAAVDLFSTIGLLYIMFIAGLELELEEFARNRHKSMLFGLFTFFLPLSIGYPLCHYVLGYDVYASLMTAGMFATHTLVAYPIVTRLGITKQEPVAVAVGGTIFTDTAVLVLLPLVLALASGSFSHALWIRLLIGFLFFAFMVAFVVPRVSRWFFRTLEGEKYSHFVYVLAVVFFCAFLAELIGLEPIIGAFGAGLALNRLIPHTSPLMNRIEFAGNALFIPFFLISVGMIIDLEVITKDFGALTVAGVLTVAAILGKWLAAYATSLAFRYNRTQRTLIFGLSSAHAAATLAIILIGYQAGIIDENILNGTIVLILVTCMVASFATESAGRKIAQGEAGVVETATGGGPADTILVSLANPDTTNQLLDLAMNIKRPKGTANIIGLSVVLDDENLPHRQAESQKLLDKALNHAAGADQNLDTRSVVDQNVASSIHRIAEEEQATDLILGYSGKPNLTGVLFGKTIENVVASNFQTIWLARLSMPLNVHSQIRVFCPSYLDKEYGFTTFAWRVLKLSSTLARKCTFYATEGTFSAISKLSQQEKVGGALNHRAFEDWEDFLILLKEFGPDDLLIIISPRRGCVSYSSDVESIPRKLAKHMPNASFLILHPPVRESEDFSEYGYASPI
jgi:Kef-type K+ transport system membrane component KefB/nucleotide-binding universal stress UspA family protein